MNTVIEIHDSKVSGINNRDDAVIVHFQPAYLHKSEGRPGFDAGSGWVQEARLIFAEAATSGDSPVWPCNVMDAELIVEAEQYRNLIPVPFEAEMLTELRLIFDSIHTVTITGRGARLELVGEPKYVEEFKPTNPAA
jgi:KaiC/GvpD/RAD55 family RecA-like ATPase